MTSPKARQAEAVTGPEVAARTLDAALPDPQPGGKGLSIIRQRADFLRAARAARAPAPAFLLQARRRGPEGPEGCLRVGFTCSRKLGNAVTRNRAKRRLRALARAVLPEAGRPGWDYVLIGRPGATVSADFARMQADLHRALDRVHRGGPASKRRP